jgi:hypothetical protein
MSRFVLGIFFLIAAAIALVVIKGLRRPRQLLAWLVSARSPGSSSACC